ncbi:tyrosine-protein phosphatase non-receptor type 1 isoform X1 [Sceloporus undulatus]|uniref:tyrosine-protein phosphatase non-receptor type 1 isoform X1 n=2 Tax=Sceloporus undulatus TaxID=8520 RepID=UPI001C4CCA9E|nr:tyrosine-protein phosphatase non-receptor type 1 isoform X1 [Sceloporus undulatus]
MQREWERAREGSGRRSSPSGGGGGGGPGPGGGGTPRRRAGSGGGRPRGRGQGRGRPLLPPGGMEIEKEFHRLDQADSWAAIYQDIRHEASDFPCKVAKLPRNKNRNRYRDVSPFDHSRIKLQQGDNDYINASLIKVEEANRSYILTQGPLPNTCGHFWEMIWEQKSRGVVMLNRVMEKGSIKCAQYWPQKEEKEMLFEDTNFTLTLVSEDIKSYYTVRQLELENLTTRETREILHFHYTTWPDFGVPESPASFLNFLFKVRESGSLSPDHGPIVVHCSAGIGRSGTFCLVDTCLLLMDKRQDPSSVDIKQVLLEMRKYRMGLIQTADQLRFSYLAVIEGAKFIMGDASVQEQWKELSNEDLDPPPEHTPPPPRPPKRTLEMNNGRVHDHIEFFPVVEDKITCAVSTLEEKVPDGRVYPPEQLDMESANQDTELRKRTVDTSPHSEEMMTPEEEEDENMMSTWKPFLVNICMFTVLTAGAYLCYRVCFH